MLFPTVAAGKGLHSRQNMPTLHPHQCPSVTCGLPLVVVGKDSTICAERQCGQGKKEEVAGAGTKQQRAGGARRC